LPELIAPDIRVHASCIAAMEEFRAEGRGASGEISSIGLAIREYGDRWQDPAVFAEFVARVQTLTPDPIALCTTLWYVDDDTYLGRLAIRHELTPPWGDFIGHIGYDVRPTARRRGHATAMLRAALPVAYGLGLDPVLVTCDVPNVASRKVIEACGGCFADQMDGKLRYWVPTGCEPGIK
jgi:predicted acetyltransferase